MPSFAQSLRQTQILILEILNVFLWLKFSPFLTLTKIEHFSKVSLPLLSVGRHTRFSAREQRTSRVAAYSQCPKCHGLRPQRGATDLPFASEHVDFRIRYYVVPLDYNLSRLNPFNLTAYGLSSRCPTLNLGDYSRRSKDSLPGGWPAFRGGILTR